MIKAFVAFGTMKQVRFEPKALVNAQKVNKIPIQFATLDHGTTTYSIRLCLEGQLSLQSV